MSLSGLPAEASLKIMQPDNISRVFFGEAQKCRQQSISRELLCVNAVAPASVQKLTTFPFHPKIGAEGCVGGGERVGLFLRVSSSALLNVVATDINRSPILLDGAFTEIPAHRDYVRSFDIPISRFSWSEGHPSPLSEDGCSSPEQSRDMLGPSCANLPMNGPTHNRPNPRVLSVMNNQCLRLEAKFTHATASSSSGGFDCT